MNPPIEFSPQLGEVVFTGTRVPVQRFFDFVEGQGSECDLTEFLAAHPEVSLEQIVALVEGADEADKESQT